MFDIAISDDSIFEDNENFILIINSSSLPSDVNVGNPGQAIVTIVDDDRKLQATYPSYKVVAGINCV